jgi:hypothetical protein
MMMMMMMMIIMMMMMMMMMLMLMLMMMLMRMRMLMLMLMLMMIGGHLCDDDAVGLAEGGEEVGVEGDEARGGVRLEDHPHLGVVEQLPRRLQQ